MSSPTARRRQRSTRVTVAVLLLTSAAVLVTTALLANAPWFSAVASVSAVVLGVAATRITHSELVQSRRDAARDRAQQARAYREVTEQRTAEHLSFVRSAEARAERQDAALRELESALVQAQQRASDAARKFNAEARRAELAEQAGRAVGVRLEEVEEQAAEAALRVSELEQESAVLRAELSAWQDAPQRLHA